MLLVLTYTPSPQGAATSAASLPPSQGQGQGTVYTGFNTSSKYDPRVPSPSEVVSEVVSEVGSEVVSEVSNEQ